MHLKENQEYKALLPRMNLEEYEALKESIRTEGQHLPIVVNSNNVILDGYTRYDICKELQIVPKTVVKDFDNELLEKMFVIDSNLIRRHLNDIQKGRLAKEKEKLYKQIAKENMKKGGKGVPIETPLVRASQQAAKDVGLSLSTYERIKGILDKGTPELIEKVERGEESIFGATKIIESWEDDKTLKDYIDREEIKEKEHNKLIEKYKGYAKYSDFIKELQEIVTRLGDITTKISNFDLDDDFRKRWYPLMELLGDMKK